MRIVRLFCLILFSVFWLSFGSAQAQHRVALVLGNSAYKSVPRLTNPVNDAALVGDMFKRAGFESVDIRTDLNAVEMRKALRDFGGRTREADVAVVYYAGHGIELDGINYLIPTDAALETDSDVLDETVALDRALFAVEPAKQLRLVILDACRDNPFAKSMKRTVAARAIGRGLAKVEPTSPNTMIAFAAKAGSTASDGDSKNSPFAAAIVERLPTPGLDLRKAFGFVRDDVLKKTGYKQEPYVYGSLGGEDVSLVPSKSESAPPQSNPQTAARHDYELALQVGTRAVWTAFLAQYPDGFYASLARGQLDRIAAEETRVATAERARIAEEERTRLAADRAKTIEQDKAAAAAKAAEDARIAAEKAKQAAEAKAAAAERQRKETEAAADKTVAKPDEKHAVDQQPAAGGKQNVAALPVCDRGFELIGDHCVRSACPGREVRNEKGECTPKDAGDTPARKQGRQPASKPEGMDVRAGERHSPSGGRCVSISQRCALEIGGRCDPTSGKWEYGRNGAGGNTQAFNACLGRMLAGRK